MKTIIPGKLVLSQLLLISLLTRSGKTREIPKTEKINETDWSADTAKSLFHGLNTVSAILKEEHSRSINSGKLSTTPNLKTLSNHDKRLAHLPKTSPPRSRILNPDSDQDYNCTSISNTNLCNQSLSNNVDPCQHKDLGTTSIILIIILISVLIIGLTGNSLIFYVVCRSRKLQRHPANFFVASLNVCNIGVILTCIPLKIHAELHSGNFCFPEQACSFYNFVDLTFHVSSVTHLWVIAVERFIAIKAPFHHRHRITRQFTKKVLIITWLYSLFWILLSFVKWQPSEYPTHVVLETGQNRFCFLHNPAYMITLNVIAYLIPIFVMAFLYGVTLQNIFHPNNKALILSSLTKNLGRKKEAALTKTIAIIYASFVFCWLPAIVISFLTNQKSSSIQIPDTVRIMFLVVMPTIPICAFPIIYAKHYEKFGEEIRYLRQSRRKKRELEKLASFSD